MKEDIKSSFFYFLINNMKPTNDELEVIRVHAILSGEEKKYVWLREDEEGTYIEYAFLDGAPHDNRCLSWYFSLQPGAITRNNLAFGHTQEDAQKEIEWRREKIKSLVGHLFTLHSFTCGYEEYPESSLKESEESWNKFYKGQPFIKEDHICRVGCPAPKCVENKTCSGWTYKEPVKCACWNLAMVDGLPKRVSIPMDVAMKFKDELI